MSDGTLRGVHGLLLLHDFIIRMDRTRSRLIVLVLACVVGRVHEWTTTESTGVELLTCSVADALTSCLRE
jgi:hypothetical protein